MTDTSCERQVLDLLDLASRHVTAVMEVTQRNGFRDTAVAAEIEELLTEFAGGCLDAVHLQVRHLLRPPAQD